MGNSVAVPAPLPPNEEQAVLGHDCSVHAIAEYIKAGKAKKVVVMCGAGISVSAGIPDFRTPGSGLYANLQKYALPRPEAIFDLSYFHTDPMPFYDLARSLYPDNFKPTPGHIFIRLLQDKGILLRCFSQNIDTLERAAGVTDEKMVEAHGSFASAHCVQCGATYDQAFVKEQILTTACCRCTRCSGFVKPDIVFFGENLPEKFFSRRDADMPKADLLLVMGTSLKVQPFASTMDMVSASAPRLLINNELVGECDHDGLGFKFDRLDNYRDAALLSTIDDGVRLLCDLLGWRDELEALLKEAGGADVDPSSHPISVDDARVTYNYRSELPELFPITPRDLLKSEAQADEDYICVAKDDEFVGNSTIPFSVIVPVNETRRIAAPTLFVHRADDYSTFTMAKMMKVSRGTYRCHPIPLRLPPYDPTDGGDNSYELRFKSDGETFARFGPLVVSPEQQSIGPIGPALPPERPTAEPVQAIDAVTTSPLPEANSGQQNIPFVSQLGSYAGSSDGQLSVFQSADERLELHRWNASEQAWKLLGEAQTAQKVEELEGVQYDMVVDIEVDSASMGFLQLKLGFNKNEDPEEVALRCCATHSLPDEYRSQIAAYVQMMRQM